MRDFFLNYQSYLICLGAIIALLLGYYIDRKKKLKILTLVLGVFGALGTLIFAVNNEKQQERFQNTLTGGSAHPYLLLWESPFYDKRSDDAFFLNFIVRIKGKNAINNLNIGIDDFYGFYMYQYFTIKVFHSSFQLIPQKLSYRDAVNSFNSSFNKTLTRLDVNDAERIYVAALPQNSKQIIIDRSPITYTIYFAWNNGNVKMDLKFLKEKKHLSIVEKSIRYNGVKIKNTDNFFEYISQE